MKTSSAKAKGRRCCAEVKDLLHKYAPDLQSGDIEVTSSSVIGEDLKLSPAARAKFPIVIECKNQEALNIWKALEQAESHWEAPPLGCVDITPVLFFRRNRSRLYVALDAEEFIRMIS